MNTRLIYLICLMLVLSLVGQVQAQDHDSTWTDATEDHLWSTPDNWSEFPTLGAWCKVRNGLPGPTIASGVDAVSRRVHVGYAEGGGLTVDGGTLVVGTDDLLLGKQGGAGILDMISGSIDVARDFEVAGGAPGIVNMSGGTIIVGDDFMIPESGGSTAEVNLNGGTIILNDSFDGGSQLRMSDGGSLNITAGTLIVDGNALSDVQGYIDNGWITAYDVNDGSVHGTVLLDYDATNVGQTTVKAVHKLNPIPADGGTALPGTIMLEWTVDAGTPVDAWYGSSSDWTTWEKVVDKQAVTSVSVTVDPKQRYYWSVDTYAPGAEDPNYGPIFSFLSDNVPPSVDAGEDVTTWIDNGSVEVALSGIVDDTDPTTTLWTVVTEPNEGTAVIADASQLDTIVTCTELGTYVLQLEASDGEYSSADTMTINVYADSCLAAQSLPGFEFLRSDINQDCIVDDLDLAILNEDWLQCNDLACPDPNAP
ncbi:hypothetical protein ACFL3F_04425 [Planctomycetota bacterium]